MNKLKNQIRKKEKKLQELKDEIEALREAEFVLDKEGMDKLQRRLKMIEEGML